jgi:hypothetical protein
MDAEERARLNEIHESVIRSEETTKWLRDNYEIQRLCCEKHEERITKLEICGGRMKGVYATVSAVAVIITMFVSFLLSKLPWK